MAQVRKLIPVLIILFFGCHRVGTQVNTKLNDTLAMLRTKTSFIPLDSAEAYDLINRYYLPRLDTLPTKRKLFIHPLNGRYFYSIYTNDKAELTAKFSGDTAFFKRNVKSGLPEPILFDKHYKWDAKKLVNTQIITDSMFLYCVKLNTRPDINEIEIWNKKFGHGYMCISYPQYNPFTKRVLIKEWLQNFWWCGNGRDNYFWFTKVPGGWKAGE